MEATPPPDEPVPLADAAIAADIARAARRGKGADRAPTLEQLLAAFGEPEPTPEARRRVGRALALARITVKPPLDQAPAGERVVLAVAGGGGRGRRGTRALLGLLLLAAILAVAAIAATVAGRDDGGSAGDDLPPDTPAGLSTEPELTPSATTTTETTPAATTQTSTTEQETAADRAAERRRERERAARRRREEAAAERRRRLVTVRVDASSSPTYLCVENGAGDQLFAGTLSGARSFTQQRVRLNIGLASTVVTVDGRRVPLDGSPAGLDVTRTGARPLALGDRPCA